MNTLSRSVLSYFRGNTVRTYLVALSDYGHIQKQLKLENLRNELGVMDMQYGQLTLQQKRVEHMLTDLTRCIRGLEFDQMLSSDLLEKQRKGKDKTSPDAPSSDKKSPKVGDFSD